MEREGSMGKVDWRDYCRGQTETFKEGQLMLEGCSYKLGLESLVSLRQDEEEYQELLPSIFSDLKDDIRQGRGLFKNICRC